MNRQVMVTPISANYKKKGPDPRRDWEHQLELEKKGQLMNWDGLPEKLPYRMKSGDILGVVYNPSVSRKGKVTFYPIIDTHDPSYRLPMWASNIGQNERCVLDLGRRICEIDWETWLSLGGHRKVQGSCRVAKPIHILTFIDLQTQTQLQSHSISLKYISEEIKILSTAHGYGSLLMIQDRLKILNKKIEYHL